MEIFYHGSFSVYTRGTVVSGAGRAPAPSGVDVAIDGIRPTGKIPRGAAVYAATTIAFATVFVDAQAGQIVRNGGVAPTPRVYRVRMASVHRGPMAIIRGVEKQLAKVGPIDSLVTAYWQPDDGWHFWEHLGESFEILEEVPVAQEVEMWGARDQYFRDAERARALATPAA